MRRSSAAALAVLLGLAPAGAQTLHLLGAGKGARTTGAVAYQGPGDIATGAKGWWGLRCYTAAYVGNVADIYSPADASHTVLTCSTGGVLNETVQPLATTCATSCTVKTLYDQSGALSCVGTVVCDTSEATESQRPAVVLSCVGGKPCMRSAGGTNQGLKNQVAFVSGGSQPYFVSSVNYRPSTFGGSGAIIGDDNAQVSFASSAANTLQIYAGNVLLATASDNTWHSVQWTMNGASSEIIVDGAAPSTGNGGGGTAAGYLILFYNGFGNYLAGDITEVGIWSGTQTAPVKAGLNSNQHSYWGF